MTNRLMTLAPAVLALTLMLSLATNAAYAVTSPQLDSKAYVLMDYQTGKILAQKSANLPLPPASLTKMMTSFIIEKRFQSGELQEDEPVLMTEDAWCHGSSSESCMYVPVGQTASAIDMLRGIIIQSGNDAAKAMAEHIAGNEPAFAQLMNQQAKQLGMAHTHFINATGMPADGHYASALALAKLARATIASSDKYYKIYAQKQFTYNGITQGNRNTLLLTDPTVDGLKTGHTNAAGYCLVASSKRHGMRLISVIMGTDSMQARADQSRELLAWGFSNFNTVVKAPAHKVVAKLPVWYGQQSEVPVATAGVLQVVTNKSEAGKVKTVLKLADSVDAPIKPNQPVGKMLAVVNNKVVGSVPVVATQAVAQSGVLVQTWQRVVRWFKTAF